MEVMMTLYTGGHSIATAAAHFKRLSKILLRYMACEVT